MVERERVILDSINEGVFTVDLDWKITSFNRAAEKITGVDREKAIGRLCSDVFRADICEKACALRRTFSDGKPLVNATAHIFNNKGEQLHVRISTALLKDKREKIIGGVETFQDLSQIERLQKELEARYTFEDIIGKSAAMKRLFDLLPQIAESSSTVLIAGDSGTGKELFAKAIHSLSPRKDKKFVAMNCAALPDTLLESELFGYNAGAFTDAKRDKPGRFLLAHGGTIFLDEIGDISPATQVKLLRVLQERTVEPLGSIEPVKVDVRVIAATNKDLYELVQEGTFRDDLYYRIRVVQLNLPRLSQHREDIPLLIDHLIAKFNTIFNKHIIDVSDRVLARLMEYDFPGNVRELENIMEHAFILCRGELIEMNHLPPEIRSSSSTEEVKLVSSSLETMEKVMITETLQRFKGSRKKTAQSLGIHPSTLYRKIIALGIETPEADGRTT